MVFTATEIDTTPCASVQASDSKPAESKDDLDWFLLASPEEICASALWRAGERTRKAAESSNKADDGTIHLPFRWSPYPAGTGTSLPDESLDARNDIVEQRDTDEMEGISPAAVRSDDSCLSPQATLRLADLSDLNEDAFLTPPPAPRNRVGQVSSSWHFDPEEIQHLRSAPEATAARDRLASRRKKDRRTRRRGSKSKRSPVARRMPAIPETSSASGRIEQAVSERDQSDQVTQLSLPPSIFRKLHPDRQDQSFWTEEKQDALTLKRANPVCSTDAETPVTKKKLNENQVLQLQKQMLSTTILDGPSLPATSKAGHRKLSEPTEEKHHYYMKHKRTSETKFKCRHALGA